MEKVRALIVDDFGIVREGLSVLLGNLADDIEVVGTATNGRDGLDQVLELCPDILITDIAMSEMSGIALIAAVTGRLPSCNAIVLSMYASEEHIYQVFKAGARGYLLHDSVGSELIEAIHVVLSGHYFISRKLTDIVIKALLTSSREVGLPGWEALNDREQQVFHLLVSGKSNREIAKRLAVSSGTVAVYRSRMMRKLNVESLPSLVKLAIRHGLTPLDV